MADNGRPAGGPAAPRRRSAPTKKPRREPGTGDRLIGRYNLTDLVAESPGTALWRAADPVLNRTVAIRLVSANDPRLAQLRLTARAAAVVDDRRIVHVLDVIDTPDGGLAVVTEWISGRNLAELVAEPLAPDAAAELALEVAEALASAHECGIAHGRILPSSVIICDTGPRVRGLGIDAVLFGVHPGPDPRRADIHGVGAVLQAALTGRWAGPLPEGWNDADGLLESPISGGRRLTPARLVAGVPRALDEFVARSLIDGTPPRGRTSFADLEVCVAALAEAARSARPAAPLPRREISAHQKRNRYLAIGAGFLAAVVLAGVGLAVLSFGAPASTTRANANSKSILFAPVVKTVPTPTTSAVGNNIPVVGITEFNPFGTGSESTDPVTLAIDGDPVSAWHTATYKTAKLDGKPGVGLILDLGAPRPVSGVSLLLVGNGTDVELRGGNSIPADPNGMELILKVSGAGQQINLRAPSPATVRYLLVWLTKLPVSGSGYQGGIAEITVQG